MGYVGYIGTERGDFVSITSREYLQSLVRELVKLPTETEWVEFKCNNKEPQLIGEYISALSNSAALCGRTKGYLVWGIQNDTHEIIGTESVSYTHLKLPTIYSV